MAFVWACDSDAVQDNGVFNIGKLKLSVWLFKMYLFFSQCQGNIDIANSNTLLLSIYIYSNNTLIAVNVKYILYT